MKPQKGLGQHCDCRYWARGWTVLSLNLIQKRRFFVCKHPPNQLQGPCSHRFNRSWGSILDIKWLQHDVDHSSPSSTKDEIESSSTSASPLCIYGLYGTNLPFFELIKICHVFVNNILCLLNANKSYCCHYYADSNRLERCETSRNCKKPVRIHRMTSACLISLTVEKQRYCFVSFLKKFQR